MGGFLSIKLQLMLRLSWAVTIVFLSAIYLYWIERVGSLIETIIESIAKLSLSSGSSWLSFLYSPLNRRPKLDHREVSFNYNSIIWVKEYKRLNFLFCRNFILFTSARKKYFF